MEFQIEGFLLMQSGKLRHRVKLQQLTEAADSTGQLTKNWNTIATLWAEVKPRNVTEFTKENLAFSTKFYDVTIRWTKCIDETMRVLYTNRNGKDLILNIENFLDLDERKREVLLTCSENLNKNK